MAAIEPFRIQVEDAALADLRARLARTRFPDALQGAGWSDGTDVAYLRELCAYWREKFDWRAREAELNRLPQFRSVVDGLGLHFVHLRSPQPDALPLLLLHGWPGSFFEFTKVLGPLADPAAHGGRAEDAFHVVCPSLPGYAFSDAPREPGWDARRVARAMAALMATLGYERYGAQAGDLGVYVATHLALAEPARTAGIHLNMLVASPEPGENPFETLTPAELERYQQALVFFQSETAYLSLHATKPQTLGAALNDSPAGLAAWIVEKFRAWSDCGGDVERRFSKDELLTNLTLYWVTRTITSSMRFYREIGRAGGMVPIARERVEVPTGCALFPREVYRAPRRWVERAYRVTRWTEMPAGGHFAALEEPERLVEDVRIFFRTLRRPGR